MPKADDQTRDETAPTRRKILRATAELIGEIGWGQVTTRRIAERAGVNNALIHYHFGSKDALLLEAATTVFTEDFEGPFTQMFIASSFTDGIRGYLAYLDTIEEHGPGVVVIVEALLRGLRDEKVRAWAQTTIEGARKSLENLVVAAQERGELAAELNPAGTSAVLGALLDGLLLYRLTDPQLDLEAVESALLRLLGAQRKESYDRP